MNIYWLNTQKGISDTVASEGAAVIALDAGVPATIYARCETAFQPGSGEIAFEVTGSGTPSIFGFLELQTGGVASKIAAATTFPALLPGSYEATIMFRVATAGLAGIYTLRLAITVTPAGDGPTASAVPVIVQTYPAMVGTSQAGQTFAGVAGFPIFIQLAASNSPTTWAGVHLPAGLALDTATGAVSGGVTGAGGYQITVTAANAAGTSVAAMFLLTISELTPGALAGGNSAALAPSWALPAELIDLQFDLRSRLCLSARLAASGGALKVGDDIRLAVLPSIGGVAITAGITSINLSIKPRDLLAPEFELCAVDLTGSPIAPVVVAGSPSHSYWLATLNLSGALIDERFSDLNADSAAAPVPLVNVRMIDAVVELRVIYNANIYTAASFPLAILQSLIDARG